MCHRLNNVFETVLQYALIKKKTNFGPTTDLRGTEIADDRGFTYMVWYLLIRYVFIHGSDFS